MLIRLRCSALDFEPNEVVDWLDPDGKGGTVAQRLVDAGLAARTTKDEVILLDGERAVHHIKQYREPKPTPATWPPVTPANPHGYEGFVAAQQRLRRKQRGQRLPGRRAQVQTQNTETIDLDDDDDDD
jgi:hypothetical protein